jgi:lipopolysaccharide transport system ATP-binding protein
MSTVIKVENISKQYRLGDVGTGALAHDVNKWWHKVRGKENPYLKIGEANDRATKGESDYVWALKDINFEVKQGEVLGIIGRNGAGKSTLLKILSKTTTPTTGSIKIKGRIASLLEVGTGFHPELSGRENIFLNGAILGMTKQEIKSKFDEIVDFAGVERYIDTPVKRYSSGMYVRLAFGVAAHLEPEILIVDEVLAVGDAEFQKKALGKMKEVSEKGGRTVLFVSHNMGAISTLCNSALILQNGEKGFYGFTQEAVKRYMNQNNFNLTNDKIHNEISQLPEDKDFELLHFEIKQEETNGIDVYADKAIEVTFNYKVKNKSIGLRVGFDIIDIQTGALIFRSFHDELEDEIKEVGIGTYFSKAEIPSNLFNEGAFYISLSIGIHNVRWIIYESIKKTFMINSINGINKIYAEKRTGMIKPSIKWTTEFN